MDLTHLIDKAHKSRVFSFLVPTLDREIGRALRDCKSVLDLGCGPKSPIRLVKGLDRSVGVEGFAPYADIARQNGTHTEIIERMLSEIEFEDREFDAVVMIDVLEHLPRDLGDELITKSKRWAAKKVVINSPNGFIEQKALDGNDLQRHLSGWNLDDMKLRGFVSRGLAGPKFLRREVQDETMGDDLLTSIRFRPRLLWFAVSTVLAPVTFRLPKLSFSLFSVHNVS